MSRTSIARALLLAALALSAAPAAAQSPPRPAPPPPPSDLGLGPPQEAAVIQPGYAGRTGEAKKRLLLAAGGSLETETAVGRGIAWLAERQKADGSWAFDGGSKADTTAATGLALLPFLAAGQTHRAGRYQTVVTNGLKYLLLHQKPDGSFETASNMYAHGIATLALCEAFGMTGDRTFLQGRTQKAVDYILKGQGANGSWGYAAGTEGDTSIVGWQIQALHAAKLCRLLTVDEKSLPKANKFLDTVASGPRKETYGYRSPGPTPTLSAIGLLSRHFEGGWGPDHPGLKAGVRYLLKTPPKPKFWDMYYFYYATQAVYAAGGPEWHRDWNPAMRKLLIDQQTGGTTPAAGSWPPDGNLFGQHCGRLGTTALAILTLQVYYRHLPADEAAAGALQELERRKK